MIQTLHAIEVAAICCTLMWFYYQSRIAKGRRLTFNKASQLYQITREILQHSSANRVLLLKAENGGPIKYGTVIIDEHDDLVGSVKKNFRRHKLDASYIQMLSKLMVEKKVINITAEMGTTDLLRRRYEADGITGSIVYFICEESARSPFHAFRLLLSRMGGPTYLFRKIYYVSISTKDPDISIVFNDSQYSSVEGMAYALNGAAQEAIKEGFIK